MSTPGTSPQPMTRRKARGLEIFAREAELRALQSAFDRERTRVFTETGQRLSGRASQVSNEERAVRDELHALAAERASLLQEIDVREAELRAQQAAFDKARRATGASQGRDRKPSVSEAEEKVTSELAVLQSERAYVAGTAGRDRESARTDEALWNTSHDPETFSSGDW